MHDHAQIRKIQSIFVHAVHARGLPAWLAAEMVRSADFDPRARRQPAAVPKTDARIVFLVEFGFRNVRPAPPDSKIEKSWKVR